MVGRELLGARPILKKLEPVKLLKSAAFTPLIGP